MQQRNQYERDLVRRPCIAILRTAIGYNQLKRYPFLYWTSPPDHGKKTPRAAGRLKQDGYEKGVYDLTIIAGNKDITHAWLIEFKYGKNDYTKEQKAIADKAIYASLVIPLKIYSTEEFEQFLKVNLK